MTFSRQHYVAIVSVFDLENIAVDRVRCQRYHKVVLSFLKLRPVVPLIELKQGFQLVCLGMLLHSFLQSVDRYRFWHELN